LALVHALQVGLHKALQCQISAAVCPHVFQLETARTYCSSLRFGRRSNRHIVHWSGSYNVPAGKMLWADIKDVAFVPKGYAYCVKPDNDLEPSAE
jgi:hypothetical protein